MPVTTRINNIHKSEYDTWVQMHQRCHRTTHPKYSTHGAIGIKVCDEWVSFTIFLSDMGKRPSEDFSLCRTDLTKNFNKDNCRWRRFRNRKVTLVYYKAGTIDLTLREWAKYLKVNFDILNTVKENNTTEQLEAYLQLLLKN